MKCCDQYTWVINQVWGQSMAGYWPSSLFFFCMFMRKKEQGQYPAILTKQSWLTKDLLYGLFSCRKQLVIQSGQDGAILPAWEASQSAGFAHFACSQSYICACSHIIFTHTCRRHYLLLAVVTLVQLPVKFKKEVFTARVQPICHREMIFYNKNAKMLSSRGKNSCQLQISFKVHLTPKIV